jgi:hypothetical protein
MGLRAGVPDLFLPYPIVYNGGEKALMCGEVTRWHGLIIEMKSKDTKGRVSEDQKKWIEYLKEQGYRVEVCWTAKEAINTIEGYLDDTLP